MQKQKDKYRHTQAGALVGRDEVKTDGRRDGRKGRVRRATFDDLNAIIDINDNIYDGLDYLPASFYILMQSKLHVIYVYEQDGKLVSLGNIRFHPESVDLVSVMSGRVHPSYQRKGLGSITTSPISGQLLKEHPAITRYVTDQLNLASTAAKIREKKLLYRWNFLVYKIADRLRLSRSINVRQMSVVADRPFSPSHSSAIEWLDRSDQLIRHVSKYVVDLFPFGSDWMPVPTNRSGLRHVLSCSKVYISLDPGSTVDTLMSSARSHPTDGHRQGGTRQKDIVGISFSTLLPCKYGLRIDIFFYGDREQIFINHVYSHLSHYIGITSHDVRLAFYLHFPLKIAASDVEERLKKDMGEKLQGLGTTEVVQYTAELPHAKL